jgi:D-glycero-D-manno-heptose 1,7-bisphosphate phosphatase
MNWPRQCAILVGGIGSRLGALTAGTPKPLLDCGGRPFLAWVMRELVRFGIEEFVLLAGYKSEQIETFCAAMRAALPRPVRIQVSVEPTPAGTGGAVFHARSLLDESFLLVNGDSWFDVNLGRFIADTAASQDAVGHVLLRRVEDASRYGVVELAQGRIREFRERPAGATAGLSNAGIYLFTRDLFDHLSPDCSLERDVLPRLAAQALIRGQIMDGYFIDIGVPADYARAGRELPRQLLRPAVLFACTSEASLFSKDGAVHGLRRWSPGFHEAVQWANDRGLHAFMVVREHVSASMSVSECGTVGSSALLLDELRAVGGVVDGWCVWVEPARSSNDASGGPSDLRLRAVATVLDDWEVDRADSLIITDRAADLELGKLVGIPAHFHDGRKPLDMFLADIATRNFGRCASR